MRLFALHKTKVALRAPLGSEGRCQRGDARPPAEGRKKLECSCVLFRGSRCVWGPFLFASVNFLVLSSDKTCHCLCSACECDCTSLLLRKNLSCSTATEKGDARAVHAIALLLEHDDFTVRPEALAGIANLGEVAVCTFRRLWYFGLSFACGHDRACGQQPCL